MIQLHTLSKNKSVKNARKRVGRGPGSGLGKTCGRGHKGSGSRSGYRKRYHYEGGGLPLYRRLPCRGFTRGRFLKTIDIINLWQIERFFQDGEVVTVETLQKHGFISGGSDGVKILGNGELTKKVKIEIDNISKGAQAKLEKAVVSKNDK